MVDLAHLDAAVREALRRSGTPGAALAVTAAGERIVDAAWGDAVRATADRRAAAMTRGTRFDVASLTKIATTCVAMSLVARRAIDLEAPVHRYVPGFRSEGRSDVGLRHLLTHTSGLPAWAPLFLRATDPVACLEELLRIPLEAAPGSRQRYSDLGMLLLGAVLERSTGERLDQLLDELLLRPLGMHDTAFGPLTSRPDRPIAATSHGNPVEWRLAQAHAPDRAPTDVTGATWWRPYTLQGEVNDANAAACGGIAGHAGLFSTTGDLTRLAGELLRAARGEPTTVLRPDVVRRFLRAAAGPDQGLGFWLRRWRSVGVLGTDHSFGHRGFTGCELLVDPGRDLTVVLLSNRLHGGDPPPAHDVLWGAVGRAVRGERD